MLDGRKGLVPSNFVEKLTGERRSPSKCFFLVHCDQLHSCLPGEDLVDFQMNVLCGARESDDNVTSLPLDFSMDCNLDDGQLLIGQLTII